MIPIAKPYLGKEEIVAVAKAISSGWVTQGPKVREFEERFADFVGTKHACAVSNCTAALHLALLAAGVKTGDFVVTVSHSFIATANSIRYCGAEPIFVDIDPRTYNMRADSLYQCLKENYHSKRVKAILTVHQMGMPCDMKRILSVAQEFKIPVIEDAACAIGSEITLNGGKKWEKIGKPHGDIACFSFHPRKVITTGEGGMLTTNNPQYAKTFRLLRHQGMSVSDLQRHSSKKVIFESYPYVGFNYRMTDIQAAMGLAQLKKLRDIIAKRRLVAFYYQKELAGVTWLKLPVEPIFARSNWQSFPLRVLKSVPLTRNQLMQYLLNKGIATRSGIMNAHEERPYQDFACSLPESENAKQDVILLPIYHELSQKQLKQIIRTIKNLKK